MNPAIKKIHGKIREAIDNLFDVGNANDALHTMLTPLDSDDMTFSNTDRNGLGVIFEMLGERAYQAANKLEEAYEALEAEEKRNSFNVANLIQQGGGDE